MTATAKTHSPKRIVLRVVLIVAIAFALLAAAAGFNWINNMYLAFNAPVLFGSQPFGNGQTHIKDLDKLTNSDKAMAKQILDENGIPYKEMYGTTIFVRNPQYHEASQALYDSGYEFDGELILA